MQAQTAVECAVDGLAGVVLFCPVDASGSLVVGAQHDAVEQGLAALELPAVGAAHVQGVLGYKGYVAAAVIHLRLLAVVRDVVAEGGVGVAVGGLQGQCLGEGCLEGCFGAQAAAAPGIDGDASQSALGKAGDLLVARLHQVGGQVGCESAIPEGEVAAHLVVPTVFRLVVGGLSHFGELFLHAANHLAKAAEAGVGGNSVHHGVAQLAADQVAEHLYVVTSRAVAAGHRGIEVVALAPLVLQGGLGQQLQVVGGELSLVRGLSLHGVLVGNAHRAHLHRKAEVGRVGGREVLHL